MAQGQISNYTNPKKVFCANCKVFNRDTEGISYNKETGEYYMGECGKGLHPDTPRKQFANKPRYCDSYID